MYIVVRILLLNSQGLRYMQIEQEWIDMDLFSGNSWETNSLVDGEGGGWGGGWGKAEHRTISPHALLLLPTPLTPRLSIYPTPLPVRASSRPIPPPPANGFIAKFDFSPPALLFFPLP